MIEGSRVRNQGLSKSFKLAILILNSPGASPYRPAAMSSAAIKA